MGAVVRPMERVVATVKSCIPVTAGVFSCWPRLSSV